MGKTSHGRKADAAVSKQPMVAQPEKESKSCAALFGGFTIAEERLDLMAALLVRAAFFERNGGVAGCASTVP